MNGHYGAKKIDAHIEASELGITPYGNDSMKAVKKRAEELNVCGLTWTSCRINCIS